MKPFEKYQYIGGKMSERDEQEVGSKFWNQGKWYNFILPFLSSAESCEEETFIDIGCNAGLFLQSAKEFGFKKVIGVESNKGAYDNAIKYRDKNNFNYEVINDTMQNSIDYLPVADVVVLSNVHYYLTENEFIEYIDKLKEKALHVIVITAEKKPNIKYAASDIKSIRNYFKNWQEIDVIDIKKDDTPHSRHLTSICFRNNLLDRVSIDSLDNGNNQQRDFLDELDKGIDLFKTNYYRRLKSYRRHTGSKQEIWSKERLIKYMTDRVELYEDVKKKGLIDPILVGDKNRIKDGNHRHEIMRHLGHKTILIKNI